MDPNTEHAPIVTGPIDSIRWEMLREGREDREYFEILGASAKQSTNANYRPLLTIPPEIVEAPRDFTRDPQPMYARRRALLDALEPLINAK